jgi:uncharacterized membrane protein YphA (DoxX/SURF4 family)
MSQPRPPGAGWRETLAVAARWLLGGLFVYMGASKAAHPEEFLKLVRQYDLTSNYWWLNAVASALPWFEIFCGALLLCGVAVRGVSLVLAIILAAFTVAVWQRALTLEAARAIPFCAVKFNCGCGTGEVFICRKLPENIGLILLCVWLLTGKGRAFSVKYALREP